MKKYTDLIIEASKSISPITNTSNFRNIKTSKTIVDSNLSAKLNLNKGLYISLLPKSNYKIENLICCIKKSIVEMMEYLRCSYNKCVVFGLGNENYIVDALGSKTIEKIKAIENKLYAIKTPPQSLSGISSINAIKAYTDSIDPDIIFLIDSLATSSYSRLASTIQLTTAGLAPGGGLLDKSMIINEEILNKPVISIGTPLIITSASNILTPYNIDLIVDKKSSAISQALNEIFSSSK